VRCSSERGLSTALLASIAVLASFTLVTPSPFERAAAAGAEAILPSPPSVVVIDPNVGSPGDQVRISGTNLSRTMSVTYKGINAPYHVKSDTEIIATVPTTWPTACLSGTFEIRTVAGAAMSPPFTIYPEIDSIDPAIGLPNTLVTISGKCLDGAVEVNFNGTKAAFSIQSPTSVRATVPLGATSGDVMVLTSDGRATADNGFTVGTPSPPTTPIGSDGAYYPLNPPKVAADSGSWRVASVLAISCRLCPTGVGLAVSTVSKLTEAHKQFIALSSITQVNRAVIVDDNLVVIGYLNGDLYGITIIDLQSERTLEDIWCSSPSLSPDHRYIAYVRFFPAHPGNDPSFTSDVYLIYDLKASPKANRLSTPSDLGGHVYVGIPVYPIENARRFSYFLGPIQDWSERHALISRFAWRSATELSFVDEHFGERHAVEIGLVDGPYRPTIRVTSLGPAKN
jgi:hypothetical protein